MGEDVPLAFCSVPHQMNSVGMQQQDKALLVLVELDCSSTPITEYECY